jgi:flotillin
MNETFMTNLPWIIGGAVFLILFIVFLTTCYVQAPPSTAFILSGLKKVPRILIGTGGFKIPIIERLDKVFLGDVTVDVKTSLPVPTHDFIDVLVDAVCKVRVNPSGDGIDFAAKNFLNKEASQIALQVKDSLEGNMREVIGAITLENLVTNRDEFSDQIQQKAAKDMAKLGLEILSCNIQNITDKQGLINDLGADNTYKIKKDAAINKANAERDIAMAQSHAKKEANDVAVKNETEIAERNNELSIKKSELKIKEDIKKAEADAAYQIQAQEQLKTVNIKTVDAEIEKTKRQQILAEEDVKVTENKLKAEVNKKVEADKYAKSTNADATKYQIERQAEAELENRKRKAEAEAYEAEQKAKAIKAQADAEKYKAQQEAAGIKAKAEAKAYDIEQSGIAEAKAIEMKGLAEAEAMQKKAEAYEKYGQVAVIDMLTKMNEKVLPEVAKYVAEPMSKIGDVTIYGNTGSEISGITENVPVAIRKSFDIMKSTTGVDMADIVRANTLQAKTDRNLKVEGDGIVQING